MIWMGLFGWLDLSWAWMPLAPAILALDSWPKWRKASVVARYIDTEYAPPMPSEAGSRSRSP